MEEEVKKDVRITEEEVRKDVNKLIPRIAEEIDIIRFIRIAHEKGLLSRELPEKDIERSSTCKNISQLTEDLFSEVGEIRSLLVLCILLSESEKPLTELGIEIKQMFYKLEEAATPISGADNTTFTGVFTSDQSEFINMSLQIYGNGEEKMFISIIRCIQQNWKEAEEDKDCKRISFFEKQRRANMCVTAMRAISNKYLADDLKMLENSAYQAKKFTSDELESETLLKVSELRRWACGDGQHEKTMKFPILVDDFVREKSTNMSVIAYILETEVIYLTAKLQQSFSSKLHQKTIERLKYVRDLMTKEQDNKNLECYRINFLRHRNCMEALCHLGVSFSLKNIPEVEVNKNSLEAAKQCLIQIIEPEVWGTVIDRWQMMTYGAMCKWFHLNSETEKAVRCAEYVNEMVQNFCLIHQETMKTNAEDLLEFVRKSDACSNFEIETFEIPEKRDQQVLKFLRISNETVIVKTLASVDTLGPFKDIPFQHILAVKDEIVECGDGFLQKAIERKRIDIIKMLLHGWDPFLKTPDGNTPLVLALRSGNAEIMSEIATAICRHFMQFVCKIKSDLLYRAWLGYIPDDNSQTIEYSNLRIVALCHDFPKTFRPTQYQNIRIYWRLKNKVSEEGIETMHYEDIDRNRQNKVPGKEAELLFKEHTNLNVIHSSSFRSTKFSRPEENIIDEPCIALYCQVKGIIPLGEQAFPKKIGNLKTDVREGIVIFGAENLRHGSGIACVSSRKSGTIGGFVKDGGNLSFITAAHVVAPCEQLKSSHTAKSNYFKSRIPISRSENIQDEIGYVIRGQFWNENSSESSVDAALVELDKLVTVEYSDFPTVRKQVLRQLGYSSSRLPYITNNRPLTRSEIDQYRLSDILKYGDATALTRGKLKIDDIHVQFDSGLLDIVEYTGPNMDLSDRHSFQFYHQLGIDNIGRGDFFQIGDSGAFCFMVDGKDSRKLLPFALAIASTSMGICIATPMQDVFQKLELDHHVLYQEIPQHEILYERRPANNLNKDTVRQSTENYDIIQNEMREIRAEMRTELVTVRSEFSETVAQIHNELSTINDRLSSAEDRLQS